MINLITSKREEIFSKKMENVSIPGLFHDIKNLSKNSKNLNGRSNYHWEDNIKLKKDLKKILVIYNKVLNILFKKLNTIHKEKFPKRYWEILIWVWLYRFIIYYFDRWETVEGYSKNLKDKAICRYFEFDEKNFIPRDTEDWCTSCVMNDDWNHWVYSKIIKKNSKIKSILINKLIKNPRKNFIHQNSLNKNYVNRVLNKFSKYLQNDKIFAQNLSFSRKSPLRLRLFFKKMGSIDKDIFWNFNQKIRIKDRNFLSEKDSLLTSNFEKFLISQIKYNFPTIFLENFKDGLKKIDKQKLPKTPKLIITSFDDIFNEPFKFYTAKNIKNNNTKLFHLQHGGSYGSSDDYPIEKIQIKLVDKFFSWGWQNNTNKIIPSFCQKTVGLNIKQSNKTKGLLLPIVDLSLYPGNIHGGRPRTIYEIDRYIGNLKIFFSNLRTDIKKDSAFKYQDFEKIYPDYVLRSLKSKFKKTVFFKSSDQACLFLKKYKLNIETLNSTGYLESLNLNLPTILIFDKSYCRVRKESLKYFKLLEQAKILFYKPREAANFINKNYNNIDEWWNSKKVQFSVKKFVNKFARSNNNPYTFLEKLKRYI